jgi:hypothetical protein
MDPSNNPRAAPIRSAIQDSRFSPLRYIRGVKPGVKRDQHIIMPVRDVYCLYSLLDRVAATAAWRRENRHDGLKYQRMTLSSQAAKPLPPNRSLNAIGKRLDVTRTTHQPAGEHYSLSAIRSP